MHTALVSRRQALKSTIGLTVAAASSACSPCLRGADHSAVADIGSRRELFVDEFLIDSLRGARRVLHHPTPREVAVERTAAWEGNVCSYTTVFQDGDLYRMYYRGDHRKYTAGKATATHPEVVCYAESADGIHWTKPELGLVEFAGSKRNNIVWDGAGSHCFTPFKDSRPDCPPPMLYKAVGRSAGKRALHAFYSADALHWQPLGAEPVIAKGAFDSQNLAFWDAHRGEYRAYVRDFRDGIRDIRTCTSPDFVNWTEPEFLQYADHAPTLASQFYTNAITPYPRAPHLLLGFPARFVDRGWTESTRRLPQRELRERVASSAQHRGTGIHDTMLMSSRDGERFDVWPESFIRPGIQRPGSWFRGGARQNWGLVETASQFAGGPNELSVYVSEGRYQQEGSWVRRHTLRLDGFVSINAPLSGGELLTRPVRFVGDQLQINFATSVAGGVRVELQDAAGAAIAGYSLADCDEQFGDQLDRVVTWRSRPEVGSLAGQSVRLRVELKDADLYAIKFGAG